MKIINTIQDYFSSLKLKKNWEAFLADDLIFTSFANPTRQITGKNTFIEKTKGFYSMIISLEVRDLIVTDEKACALTRYQLQPTKGDIFTSDVAEIFTVKDDKIASLSIYFDSSPYPKP